MSWTQLTFVVNAEQVERLSDIFESFLAQAITHENAGKDEYFEVAFPGTPSWQKVRVTALFDSAVEMPPIIDFVHQQLASEQELPHSLSHLVDQDWERVWLDSFKPIKVGKNLWVCPSWCEPVKPDERNIILDPGLAFGTGTHPTTALCLAWLAEQNLSNQTVLDYGSGSGILAIAALFSGADLADSVDIDPLAVDACNSNADINQVSEQMQAFLPDERNTTKQYDIVIANILADVIIGLRKPLLAHLKQHGRLLLTGILSNQADRVMQAFANEIDFTRQDQQQWCLLIGNKLIGKN